MIKIKKITPTAKIPNKAHATDLGYDLFADMTVHIAPGKTANIRTGIAIGFPEGYGGLVKDRSSMAMKNIVTSGGVIDEAYIGEITVFLSNHGDEEVFIYNGDKIAQIVLIPTTNFSITEVDNLSQTERGSKGFGSSGN
jgi:dUTP pyrophosphatase